MVTRENLSLAGKVETLEQDNYRLNALVGAERRAKDDALNALKVCAEKLETYRKEQFTWRSEADGLRHYAEGLEGKVKEFQEALELANNRANNALGDWQDKETALSHLAYLKFWVNDHARDRQAWDADRTRLEAEVERLLEVGESSDTARMEKIAYLQEENEGLKRKQEYLERTLEDYRKDKVSRILTANRMKAAGFGSLLETIQKFQEKEALIACLIKERDEARKLAESRKEV